MTIEVFNEWEPISEYIASGRIPRLGANRILYLYLKSDNQLVRLAPGDYATRAIYKDKRGRKRLGDLIKNTETAYNVVSTLDEYAETAERVIGKERLDVLEKLGVSMSAHQRANILREEYQPTTTMELTS